MTENQPRIAGQVVSTDDLRASRWWDATLSESRATVRPDEGSLPRPCPCRESNCRRPNANC